MPGDASAEDAPIADLREGEPERLPWADAGFDVVTGINADATIEACAGGAVDPRPLVAATVGLWQVGAVLAGERPEGAGPGAQDPRRPAGRLSGAFREPSAGAGGSPTGSALRDPTWDADGEEAPLMRKALAGAALLVALTLALAACGGSGDKGSGTAAPAEPATTAAQAAGGTTVAVASGTLGDILVDGDGRTLYAFTKDQGDQSACSGQCADNWPALTGTATAGTGAQASLLSASMQANGDNQVTYDGKPLYYFAGDAKPGDVNGQGVGDVWFVLSADGELVRDKAAEKEATGGYP